MKPTAGPHKDRVLLVVEVKLKAMSEQHAEEQLLDYMGLLAEKYNADTEGPVFSGDLGGLLVMGNQVKICVLPVTGGSGSVKSRGFRHGAVHAFLQKIVTENS